MPSASLSSSDAAAHASQFARMALANIEREYPSKLDHVLNDASDVQPPRALHPAFFGSFDWHSCVHMHWTLARLLRLFPDLPEAERIRLAFHDRFTEANIAVEIAYLRQPSRQSFERTYGWAWLLKLQAELLNLSKSDRRAGAWCSALAPLADAFVDRYLQFLPLAHYPIRTGTHANSAFGLLFALDFAEAVQHFALRKLIVEKANGWFGRDRRYPAAYEPGGEDFLSPGLMEAVLMMRTVDSCSYADWWQVFCPAAYDLQAWLTPVIVSDRSDPKLAHLDGLNLSRAWCWRLLEQQLPPDIQPIAGHAIDAHLDASLPHAVHGDYAGTHWLASFALLALTER
ncbi:MAG TPA: DUF2891 domain-containing protein [Noviherbaspirillum sp.]|nr:DUF2891 domain-containing protein [Noviherbaspirillum sp.]